MKSRNYLFQIYKGIIEHISLLQNQLRELIFLPIYPQVGEGLLSAVQYLNQVVKWWSDWIVV